MLDGVDLALRPRTVRQDPRAIRQGRQELWAAAPSVPMLGGLDLILKWYLGDARSRLAARAVSQVSALTKKRPRIVAGRHSPLC